MVLYAADAVDGLRDGHANLAVGIRLCIYTRLKAIYEQPGQLDMAASGPATAHSGKDPAEVYAVFLSSCATGSASLAPGRALKTVNSNLTVSSAVPPGQGR